MSCLLYSIYNCDQPKWIHLQCTNNETLDEYEEIAQQMNIDKKAIRHARKIIKQRVENKHTNDNDIYNHQEPKSQLFVDDNFSAIVGDKNKGWEHVGTKTEDYIQIQEDYHSANGLLLNKDKTQFMMNLKEK